MSDIIKISYWKDTQKRLIGWCGSLSARFLLLTSTKLATTIEMVERTRPIPTR